MGRLVIFPHPLLETAAELIQGTELRQVERSVPMIFQRKEPAFNFLSEYSDKKFYTTDFFIRIFREKAHKYYTSSRKDADKIVPVPHNGSIKY